MSSILRHPWTLTLAATIFGWIWVMAGERAMTQAQLGEFEREIGLLQDSNQTTADRLMTIQTTVTQTQTDVKWIRRELTHLRQQQETTRP